MSDDASRIEENSATLQLTTTTMASVDAAAIDAPTAISTFAGVSATLIGFLGSGPVIVGVTAGLTLFSFLLPPLWGGSADKPTVWSEISGIVGDLIDRKLEALVLATATTRLKTMQEGCQQLLKDLLAWKTSRNGRDGLVQNYRILLNDVRSGMNSFVLEGYESVLLTHYVSAGLAYLPVLRAVYEFADELGLHTRSKQPGKDQVLLQFRNDINKIVDQALRSYELGKKKIIHEISVGETASKTWIDLNDYRNTITVTALDFLAMLPYFDPIFYPIGAAKNNLNRLLVTLLETNPKLHLNGLELRDLEAMDELAHLHRSVELLNTIELRSGYTMLGTSPNLTMLNGLATVRCELKSIDGFGDTRYLDRTGHVELPLGSLVGVIEVNMDSLFFLQGWHRTGKIKSPNDSYFHDNMTACDFHIFERHINNVIIHEVKIESVFAPNSPGQVKFVTSIPKAEIKPENPGKYAMLKEFAIVSGDSSQHDAYLFTWRSATVGRDMLPSTGHEPRAGANRVEIFHAIKAARSIVSQGMKIVPGPGYTGGDLVKLAPQQNLEFKLTKDPARWFNGRYEVRIWYYRSLASASIVFFCIPEDSVSARLTATLPASDRDVDPENPKHEDLISFNFTGRAILPFSAPTVILGCLNQSLTNTIVLDRIELIFDGPASDPIDLAQV